MATGEEIGKSKVYHTRSQQSEIRRVPEKMACLSDVNGGEKIKLIEEDKQVALTDYDKRSINTVSKQKECFDSYNNITKRVTRIKKPVKIQPINLHLQCDETSSLKKCNKMMKKMERMIEISRRSQRIDYVQLYNSFDKANMFSVLDPIFLPPM